MNASRWEMAASRWGQGNQAATPQELAAEKKFAQCVRQHGYPSFPDPSPSGGFQSTPGGPPLPAKSSPAFQACRGQHEIHRKQGRRTPA